MSNMMERHPNTVAKPLRFNAQLLAEDLALKGWTAYDLAKKAGVSDMTVYRFLRGDHQTPITARKLAKAMSRPLARYLISSVEAA